MVTPLNPLYVKMINGFKVDCDNLILKFKEQCSGDFREFVQIWKSFKFYLVYEKYNKNVLTEDFKSDTLQIAKAVMLNDHFVGGMFLLYALYYIQEDPKSSIRLELNEFEKIVAQLGEERKPPLLENCQPGYVFAKLLTNDAFAFVKFSRDFSTEGQNRARLIFTGQILTEEEKRVDTKDWFQGFLERTGVAQDLQRVEEEYIKKKIKIKEEHPELNMSLNMVPDNILEEMQDALTHEEVVDDDDPVNDIGTRRRWLKNRTQVIKQKYKTSKMSEDDAVCVKDEGEDVKIKKKKFVKKKLGAPSGMKKKFFNSMINDPEESEESAFSDLDEPKLSLPTI